MSDTINTEEVSEAASFESELKPKNVKIKLTEGIAHKNKEKLSTKARVPIYIKQEHLHYEEELKKLQIELMKLQNYVKEKGQRIVMLFEGRDAAGIGGTIKRITAHMNTRGIRVIALNKPNDTEKTQWYFQRYIQHLPSEGEFVLFDRSWYNRAMVEPVMDFCTDEQHKRFLKSVPDFEEMLVKDGIILFKFYFSVSKKEQKRRFKSREKDILKQYKLSPVDKLAQQYWHQYSIAKFQMMNETNRSLAPWTVIRSDNKKQARLNCIKHILSHMEYDGKISAEQLQPDPEITVSGIDEISHMEKNLMTPKLLHG
jgi:polyphosphate kinase 2